MSNTLQSMSSFIRISSGRLFRFPVNKSNLLILVCTVDILYGSLYLMESIDNLIIFRVVFTFYPHSNISWLISRFLALHFPFCFCRSRSVHPSLSLSECLSSGCFLYASVWQTFPFRSSTVKLSSLPYHSCHSFRGDFHVMFRCFSAVGSSSQSLSHVSSLYYRQFLERKILRIFVSLLLTFFSSDRHTISHCSTCLQKIKIIDFTRSCSIFILFLLVRPVCSRRVPYDVFLMMTPTVFCCVCNHVVLLHVHTDRKFSKMKIVRISLIHAVEWDPHNVDLNFCYTQ